MNGSRTRCQLALLALLAVAGAATAQQMAPPTPSLAPPRDIPFPGTLTLTVDATDLDHRVFNIHEVIPVTASGDLVLLFPKWLPGHHAPGTEIRRMAGLKVSAKGALLPWYRDPVAVNAFHVTVPTGVAEVAVDFQYLSPTEQRIGRVVMSADMLRLQWTFASLYPAGYYAKRIPVQAAVKLPAGWQYATSLETAGRDDDGTVVFKTTDYDTLIDSPLLAGRYARRFDLDPGATVPVRLDAFADRPDELDAPDALIAAHRKLVQQAYRLFGSHHFDHYDFLVSASDVLGGIGLEHHRSSEDGVRPTYFTDPQAVLGRTLLPHEFAHSWNGKFRRPDDLWTPDYQEPMRDSLLWVYEGQTQYWGEVLTARAGLYSHEQALESLAEIAATYDHTPGRTWRNLQDTTNDPIVASRAPQSWRSWQRSEDYYSEGLLVWLDVDTLIRQRTHGRRSLDDFARAFFGVEDGDWGELTYDFDAVVAALDKVYPYNWAAFLRARLDGHGLDGHGSAPLDGLTRGGYRLVYQDTPGSLLKAGEARYGYVSLAYSLGITIGRDNVLSEVLWDGPAFRAGVASGATLVAVNGRAYSAEVIKAAITAAKGGTAPIELLIRSGDTYRTVAVDYHGGLRYPRLERIPGTPALLDDILAERR